MMDRLERQKSQSTLPEHYHCSRIYTLFHLTCDEYQSIGRRSHRKQLWTPILFLVLFFLARSCVYLNQSVLHHESINASIENDLEIPKKDTNSKGKDHHELLEQEELKQFVNISVATETCTVGEDKHEITMLPHAIVIGVQKGGTSSINHYLSQHVHALPTKKTIDALYPTEAHFFDWHMPLTPLDKQRLLHKKGWTEDEFVCWARQQYFDLFRPSIHSDQWYYRVEKTPAYFFKSAHIPQYIHQVVPEAKLILVLREPVERAYSQHCMEITNFGINATFIDRMNKELRYLESAGLTRVRPMEPEISDQNSFSKNDTLDDWDLAGQPIPKNGPTRDGLSQDDIVRAYFDRSQSAAHLRRGMYSIPLKLWLQYFSYPNQLLIIKYDDFRTMGVEAVYRRILNFLGLPYHKPASDFVRANEASPECKSIHPRVKRYLQRFYAPYNLEISQLLKGDEWKDGVWKYSNTTIPNSDTKG